MINHRSNCRIEKIGCYYIPLYRRSSRAGDKRTRTAEILHRENQERGALPPFPPDSLVLRMLVLKMSDCPSPTLTAQLKSGQLMRSTY
ncbi:hypothetical protein AQUCO_01000668v1 [Aquilegia coerulea]|uniref:Uncharacterized protein n=1 Tax=Aquilegia coerulea TaxID=218851 RepID=A0A2G5EB26_AQUCA|nr:hypothetical protein AQUCO_01000668v1 [Aquilegia coerulea]